MPCGDIKDLRLECPKCGEMMYPGFDRTGAIWVCSPCVECGGCGHRQPREEC